MHTNSLVPKPLQAARDALYAITGGSYDSANVRAARLSTAQRIDYIRSAAFTDWVASEKAAGRQIFWLKDVDKTQAAGDIFTFFFQFRYDNQMFMPEGVEALKKFLAGKKLTRINPANAGRHVLELWLSKETGGKGISMLDFWAGAYWPSQTGLTKPEKLRQVQAFAPLYGQRIYPGVKEENLALKEAGVNVVIVSNGDQDLARAVAPQLGIFWRNVVGSHLMYGPDGKATGVNHAYEIFGDDWVARPQPGKRLSFHYFLTANKWRWKWQEASNDKWVIAGIDGDSASADGGMMIYLSPPAIGNFMVNTPGEPGRIEKFYPLVDKYGDTRGQFITLDQAPSEGGNLPAFAMPK